MSTYLVTGANRGIGLEICRQLLALGHQVIATCRQASEELQALELQIITGIRVGEADAADKLRAALGDTPLDGVINNAGLLERTVLSALDFESIERQMQVNAYGPLRVVVACLPNLSAGGKILMITSQMGSITDNGSGGHYGYRMSKAALNMAGVSLAHDLKSRQIAVGLMHPGYVRTDMTGHQGHLTPEESASGILARLEALSLETTGQFWHVNGQPLPW